MKYLNITLTLFLLILITACGKPSLEEMQYQTEVDLAAGVAGEIYDPANSSTTAYAFSFGPQEEERIHYRFQSANFLSPNAEETNLYIDVHDVIRFVFGAEPNTFTEVETHPIFTLRFYSGFSRNTVNDFAWSAAEFVTYFAPGTIIPVGNDIGQVAVGIRLPEVAELDLPSSQSSYLPWAEGQFEVISVEDHTFDSESSFFPDIVTGKMVEGILSAAVGRYVLALDEADGVDGYFTNDDVLLQNFRVRFFVRL